LDHRNYQIPVALRSCQRGIRDNVGLHLYGNQERRRDIPG
jgi:hypothetical protein